jgi:hypothetical protein
MSQKDMTPEKFQTLTLAKKVKVFRRFQVDMDIEYVENPLVAEMDDEELDKLDRLITLRLFYLKASTSFFVMLRVLYVHGDNGSIDYLDLYPIPDGRALDLVASWVTLNRVKT